MRKSKAALCVAAVVLGLSTVSLAEGDVSVGLGADFMSKYVWRGQNLVDDWVFQPSVSASYKGLTGSIWGNLDMTDENDRSGEFTEVDYSVDYSGSVSGVDVLGYSIGAIYYDFPGSDVSGTTELYWGFSLDVPASPSITVYHDVDEADGIYASLGVSHSIEATEKIPVGIDLGATVGWGNKKYNEFYWGTDGSELNDLVLSVGFPFEVAGVSVTPSVSYITLLGSDVKDSDAYDTDNSIVVVGVGLAKEF
jgi:outer membrane scaffolding protein for murein synthesis (MipA/OmpV family)